jgi:WhiB family redox-sensing transcriptional regulator
MSNTVTFPIQLTPYWEELALCAQTGPELFFVTEKEQVREKKIRTAKAKAICASCPVISKCLQRAVDTNDMHAIMGGTTPQERGHSGDWTGKITTSWSVETILNNIRKQETNANK